MRVPPSTAAGLCPLLVCLCVVQSGYGTPQGQSRTPQGQSKSPQTSRPVRPPSRNQSKPPDTEKDVHHRPKRGWIWNQFFVLEEHIGPEAQYVGKLHSNSDNGDGSVRYLLSGEGAGTIFVINEVTGDIHAARSLDRERKGQYVLHAQAVDRHSNRSVEPESEFIIKVQDVNDNAPRFPEGALEASVAEMADVGTSVCQVTATDADDPTYGNSAKIVYSILQGHPYFSVDSKTGVIRTALANMDREARERYLLVVQAKDMAGSVGGLSGTTTVNVTLTDVNDNPPRFPQKNYQLYVPESAPVGKAVGRIKANDEDLGANADMDYSITNPDGAALFSITADGERREGIVSLRQPLNYEKRKAHTLHIEGVNTHLDPRFSHLGPFRDAALLRVVVGDVDEPPVFSMDYYILDVYENSPPGTPVGTVTARDPDSTKSAMRYFIDNSAEGPVYFSVGVNSGVIRTTQPLDREEVAWHNITVMAAEVDNPRLVSQVAVTVQVLDVNDNAPSVAGDDRDVVVCESARAGQVIQTIRPADMDNFANGRFSFALSGELPANPNFTLKDNEDNTASVVARRRVSREAEPGAYLLPVVVRDGGEPSLSGTATLTLRVCVCLRTARGRNVCQAQAFLSTAGLSTGAFVAILLCVLILLAIMVLFLTLRSKKASKEALIVSEEDVRENVVTYDDEGGGEEDTEAFDIAALRNPGSASSGQRRPPRRLPRREAAAAAPEAVWLVIGRRPVAGGAGGGGGSPSVSSPCSSSVPDSEDAVRRVLGDKVAEADLDCRGPPYDSLQTYAYEGRGSPSGSISSLGLAGALPELKYSDLDDWEPDPHTLERLFGDHVSELSP